MTLLTMHRILIGSGVAVFLLYALHEATSFAAGDGPAAARGVLSVAAALALVAYLRWLHRRRTAALTAPAPQPPRA